MMKSIILKNDMLLAAIDGRKIQVCLHAEPLRNKIFGEVGERLWVKETWTHVYWKNQFHE